MKPNYPLNIKKHVKILPTINLNAALYRTYSHFLPHNAALLAIFCRTYPALFAFFCRTGPHFLPFQRSAAPHFFAFFAALKWWP